MDALAPRRMRLVDAVTTAVTTAGRSGVRTGVATVAVTLAVTLAAGCTGDDATGGTVPGTAAPPGTVEVPPARLSPFCQGMIDLSAQLASDPPDDERAYIVERYRALLDVVPPEIEPELRAVLARLEDAGSAPATTNPPDAATEDPPWFDAEGRLPDDDPAGALNTYVDVVCRGSTNNPGPPATAPDEVTPAGTGP